MNPKVSVIICSYTIDRLQDIHEAVASSLNQTLKPHEVIVSVDHTKELFNRLKEDLPSDVKVVLNEGPPGFSETKNVGIRNSTGDVISFLDDDAIADPNWLENIVIPLEDPTVAAVGGQVIPLWPRKNPPSWFPEEFDFMIGGTAHKKLVIQANGEIRNVNGGNNAFRREVFDEIGLWNSDLGRCNSGEIKFNPAGGEEAEFCLRIKRYMPQTKVLFKAEAIVYHKVGLNRATMKYIFKYAFREGITRALLQRIVSQYKDKPLAAENRFLFQILFKSIPSRIIRFYRISNLTQVGTILTNLTLMATGYLIGRWQYSKVVSK